MIKDGNEHFTIQYAKDGVNFEIASITELMPVAAGPFVPDAFTDTRDGRGITWGICHNVRPRGHSLLMRFDCDLSLDVNYPEMKMHKYVEEPEHFYRYGLSPELRKRIEEQAQKLKETEN